MNKILRGRDDVPTGLKKEYRLWRDRMEHLLKEFDNNVRNKYEHPTFDPLVCGNIIMWGSVHVDREQNIRTHVEGELYSEVRKSHVERLDSLRIDLIDLFLKYFSDKNLSIELLKSRKDIEENIDEYIGKYEKLILV